ncbi:MAG TPA: HNH endonuclease signature motif containing protein, partial [Trebonia sp.]|nr:HNH endonuclease signature motif containing protein [Trebonia sp.]
DACDHAAAEDRYTPGRQLRHLLRARHQRCTAPGCNAQALFCDLDHTVPYPDGPTCQCNLNPKCRRHHRTKQAPGWTVTQPAPGTVVWTTPSGRSHTTAPTAYDL